MHKIFRNLFLLIFLAISPTICFGQEFLGQSNFSGVVNSDNINVRTDANTSSKVICKLNKQEVVEVVLEKFGWCKIRLPKSAPSYVKKSFFTPLDEKTAKADKTNINIRLEPSESAPILGKIQKNEVVALKESLNDWYKITPTAQTFGWVHKKFIDKTGPRPLPQEELKIEITKKPVIAENKPEANQEMVVLEGLLYPYGKVIKRQATHKLITQNKLTYLLRGNTENLKNLTYHKVKITGKILPEKKGKLLIIEVIKLEALD